MKKDTNKFSFLNGVDEEGLYASTLEMMAPTRSPLICFIDRIWVAPIRVCIEQFPFYFTHFKDIYRYRNFNNNNLAYNMCQKWFLFLNIMYIW